MEIILDWCFCQIGFTTEWDEIVGNFTGYASKPSDILLEGKQGKPLEKSTWQRHRQIHRAVGVILQQYVIDLHAVEVFENVASILAKNQTFLELVLSIISYTFLLIILALSPLIPPFLVFQLLPKMSGNKSVLHFQQEQTKTEKKEIWNWNHPWNEIHIFCKYSAFFEFI